MVNGINSLISLSGYSLLVYSNARDFCVLISSSDFLIVSVEFSMCSIVLSANSESFTSFPVWIPFNSFSSLIAMARISKTMLNNSGKSGHTCLVPYLRGNSLFFTIENICCGFIIHGLYYVEMGSSCA